jgi:glycosyltransferase involved in cell wall biosynthesis
LRLAWFSPWPPDPSGIAGRSFELVPLLAARGHGIDVFVDERRVPADRRQAADAPAPGRQRVLPAHDFVWRMTRGSYDLVVYQVGNSHLHDHIWPYLFRWPGLAVLHDGRVHHARALALLSRGRAEDYRAEFAWSHPDVDARGSNFALGGFDGVYHYQWPMIRGVLGSSRVCATHARGAAAELARSCPERPVEYIALGEGLSAPVSAAERQACRAAHGLSDRTVVFGVFGGLTAEKRVPQVLRAFAATRARHPDVRLVLAGQPEPLLDLDGLIASLDLASSVLVPGRLDAGAFDTWIASVDVSLNLRWPSALETSGPWLRALSAARPTVVIDHAHLAAVPTIDPRTWLLHAPALPHAPAGVAIAIDILDEDHSLRLAMRRLASDTDLRTTLGRHARAYWEAEHTVARMADDYERVMARALAAQPAPIDRPAHMAPDPWAHTRNLLAAFGDQAVSDATDLAAPEAR